MIKCNCGCKYKVFPYSLPSVGPGADLGVDVDKDNKKSAHLIIAEHCTSIYGNIDT